MKIKERWQKVCRWFYKFTCKIGIHDWKLEQQLVEGVVVSYHICHDPECRQLSPGGAIMDLYGNGRFQPYSLEKIRRHRANMQAAAEIGTVAGMILKHFLDKRKENKQPPPKGDVIDGEFTVIK